MVPGLKKKSKASKSGNAYSELEKELKSIKADLIVEAKKLSELRQTFAQQLTKKIHQELKDLYMEKTIFEPHFLQTAYTFDEFSDGELISRV